MDKKNILILGATGMLGSAVYGHLRNKYKLIVSLRDNRKIKLLEKAYGKMKGHRAIVFDAAGVYNDFLGSGGYPGKYFNNFVKEVGKVDYVINAVGITKPFSLENPALTMFINGALPHILSSIFKDKLIHITTDCVYDGLIGFPYNERSSKTPVDLYGLSKSMGEPEASLTLRTSIIGRELEGHTGLLDWFLKQEGKKCDRYRF